MFTTQAGNLFVAVLLIACSSQESRRGQKEQQYGGYEHDSVYARVCWVKKGQAVSSVSGAEGLTANWMS